MVESGSDVSTGSTTVRARHVRRACRDAPTRSRRGERGRVARAVPSSRQARRVRDTFVELVETPRPGLAEVSGVGWTRAVPSSRQARRPSVRDTFVELVETPRPGLAEVSGVGWRRAVPSSRQARRPSVRDTFVEPVETPRPGLAEVSGRRVEESGSVVSTGSTTVRARHVRRACRDAPTRSRRGERASGWGSGARHVRRACRDAPTRSRRAERGRVEESGSVVSTGSTTVGVEPPRPPAPPRVRFLGDLI